MGFEECSSSRRAGPHSGYMSYMVQLSSSVGSRRCALSGWVRGSRSNAAFEWKQVEKAGTGMRSAWGGSSATRSANAFTPRRDVGLGGPAAASKDDYELPHDVFTVPRRTADVAAIEDPSCHLRRESQMLTYAKLLG